VLAVGRVVVLVLVAFLLLPLQTHPLVVVLDFHQGEPQSALVSQPQPIQHHQPLGQWLLHHPEPVSQAPQAQFSFVVF
jgi:hypothetical protein